MRNLPATLTLLTSFVISIFGLPAHATVDLSKFADAASSDPLRNGIMTGFPPKAEDQVRFADGSLMKFPYTRWSFSHMRELLPTVNVWRGNGPVSELPRAEQPLGEISFTDMHGEQRTWTQALEKTWTDGVLVMHRGRIIEEQYFGALQPERPHIAMSVTKSFVGTLAAMLAAEGLLDPSAAVTDYLPELAGTAWGDASVRSVMDMTTGVQYSEDYADPKAEIFAYMVAGGIIPAAPGSQLPGSFYAFLQTLPKQGEHDHAFAYKTVNTEVLAWLLQRVSQQSLAELLSQRIWQKLGAEQDAYLLVDRTGAASGGGGLNTTLRDLARFGETMRLKGQFNGQQIVPEAVVADIAAGADPAKFAKAGYTTLPGWSYRNMWWVSDQGFFMARGIYGQAIYVDPQHEVVIVRYGSHPLAANSIQDPLILPAYRAVAAHLAAQAAP
jgi:CubicO group peptidase (beta-lactamase class C family)